MRAVPLPRRMVWAAVLVGFLAACAAPGAPGGGPDGRATEPPPPAETPTDQRADAARLERLEQEARALAKPDGCPEGSQCGVVPVGEKACGGPRYWLPYCPISTDVAALRAKIEELRTAEAAFNRKYGIISDCLFVSQPPVTSAGGTCRAQ